MTPHASGAAVPDFGFYYDGTVSGSPRVVVQVAVGGTVNFDLGLVTSTATTAPFGFDPAGLSAGTNATATGIRNVVVGGNLLPGGVPAGAASSFGLPNSSGGVQLPRDDLAVAAAGTLPAAGIVAHTIASAAAGSFAGVSGSVAANTDVLVPPAAGTALAQANDTYRVFVSTANSVAQFLVTGPTGTNLWTCAGTGGRPLG